MRITAVSWSFNKKGCVTVIMKLKAFAVMVCVLCGVFITSPALAKGMPSDLPAVSHDSQGGPLLVIGDREEMVAFRALTRNKQIAAIATGWATNVAVTTDGTLLGVIGQYDDRYDFKAFMKQTQGKKIAAIAVGNGHYLAATREGTLIAHGNDERGAVSGILKAARGQSIMAVAAGTDHSLALTAQGVLLAAGSPISTRDIVKQAENKKIALISAGAWSSLAVTQDGTLLAGGYEDSTESGGYNRFADILAQAKGKKIVAIDAAFGGALMAVTANGELLVTHDQQGISKLSTLIARKQEECQEDPKNMTCRDELKMLQKVLAEYLHEEKLLDTLHQDIAHEKIVSAAFGGGNGGSWSINALSASGRLFITGSNAAFIQKVQDATQGKTFSAIAPGNTIGYDSMLLIERRRDRQH